MTEQIQVSPETKQKLDQWTEALRSGEFEQGKSYLRVELSPGAYAYCCLGVLCELADRSRELGMDEEEFGDMMSGEYPENAVYGWPGIDLSAVRVEENSDEIQFVHEIQFVLAERNDNDVSFTEIADYIDNMFVAKE